MKLLFATCIATACLSAASLEPIKVTLPAPVMVGGVEMSSGECTIHEIPNGGNVVLSVRSRSGQNASILVNRISRTHDSGTGIVLTRQNDRLSLDQVWINAEEGFEVLRAPVE